LSPQHIPSFFIQSIKMSSANAPTCPSVSDAIAQRPFSGLLEQASQLVFSKVLKRLTIPETNPHRPDDLEAALAASEKIEASIKGLIDTIRGETAPGRSVRVLTSLAFICFSLHALHCQARRNCLYLHCVRYQRSVNVHTFKSFNQDLRKSIRADMIAVYKHDKMMEDIEKCAVSVAAGLGRQLDTYDMLAETEEAGTEAAERKANLEDKGHELNKLNQAAAELEDLYMMLENLNVVAQKDGEGLRCCSITEAL
jgi:hypothetical protein